MENDRIMRSGHEDKIKNKRRTIKNIIIFALETEGEIKMSAFSADIRSK